MKRSKLYYQEWPPCEREHEESDDDQENAVQFPSTPQIEAFPVHKEGQNTLLVLSEQNTYIQRAKPIKKRPNIKEENIGRERRAHLLKSLVTRLKNQRPHAMHWYSFVKRPKEARSRYPLTKTLKGYSKVMAKSYPEFQAVFELYNEEDWDKVSEDVFEIPYIPPYAADFIQLKPPVLIPKPCYLTEGQPFTFLLPKPFSEQQQEIQEVPQLQQAPPTLHQIFSQAHPHPHHQVSEQQSFITHFQSIPLPTEQHHVCMSNQIFVHTKDNVVSLPLPEIK